MERASKESLLKQKWTKNDSVSFIESHGGVLGPDGYYRVCYYGQVEKHIIKIVNNYNFKEVKYLHNYPTFGFLFDIFDFVKKLLNVSHKEALNILETYKETRLLVSKVETNSFEVKQRNQSSGCFYVKNILCFLDENSETWVSYNDIENIIYPVENRTKKFTPQGLWGALGTLYATNVLSMAYDSKYINNKLCFNVKTLKCLLTRQLNKKGKTELGIFYEELIKSININNNTNQQTTSPKENSPERCDNNECNIQNTNVNDINITIKKLSDILKQTQSAIDSLIKP